jgi:hypothetical protein
VPHSRARRYYFRVGGTSQINHLILLYNGEQTASLYRLGGGSAKRIHNFQHATTATVAVAADSMGDTSTSHCPNLSRPYTYTSRLVLWVTPIFIRLVRDSMWVIIDDERSKYEQFVKNNMRSVQISKPNGPFEVVERKIPEPGNGKVRIKVQACDICHGDSVTKLGLFPDIKYPSSWT